MHNATILKNTLMMNTDKLVLENMLEVLEYERKRISLNLHDSVQNKIRLLRDEIHDPVLRQKIEEILDELRTIAYNLVPKSLQEFPLAEYLQIYTATLNKTYLNQFHVDYRTNVQLKVPKEIETELFNIVQECFTNIIKYADTPIVLLRYNQLPNTLEVIVEDMGKGFDLENALQTNSIGLKSIQARTDFIGGECSIQSNPDEVGARVKITVPIQESWQNEEKSIFDEDLEERFVPDNFESQPSDTNEWVFLLVDNQPEITRGLIPILKEEWPNATYIACTSVKKAKTVLKSKSVDVVITDITMPDNSGLELVEHIKEHYPKTKILIYSINDNPVYVYRAVEKLKVQGYVWKEQTHNENEKHHLIMAIRQIRINPSNPYFSAQIEETRTYLKHIDHNPYEDKKNRAIFKQYAMLLKKTNKGDLIEGNKKWREFLGKQTRDNLGLVADHTSINRYFRQFKSSLLIDDDWELIQLILRVANDFGFFETGNTQDNNMSSSQ